MSDTNVVGDLVVNVGADLADLSNNLSTAVSEVEKAGQDMAGALDGIDIGAGPAAALAGVGDAAAKAGEDAGAAAPKLHEAGDAAEQAGAQAEHGAEGFKGMIEALVGLGEALLVAEGLKELAAEALAAYDNVQKATISLTALTGSATQATEMVERLKDVALSNALSFPDLLTAQTRMTALGLSAEQSASMMQLAADASKTMGTDFLTVVTQMDRMITSGAVMPRTLAGIGTSAQALGDIMGVTAAGVAAAFKILDDPARGEVLQAAMIKTAGVAQAQALLISGQLQNIATSWEFMLEKVGPVLAQALQPVLDFIKDDIIPAIQGMVEWFGQLSQPVQDFAIALGALTVAGGLLAAAIGAVAVVLAPIEPIVLGVGAAVVVLAAGFGAMLETSPTLRASMVDLGRALGDLWSTVEKLVAPSLPDLSQALQDLAVHAGHIIDGITVLVTGLNTLIGSVASAEDWLTRLLSPTEKLEAPLNAAAAAMGKLGAKVAFLGAVGGDAVLVLEFLGLISTKTTEAAKSADEMGAGWSNAADNAAKLAATASEHARAQLAAAAARAAAEAASKSAAEAAAKAWTDEQNDYLKAQTLADQALSNIKRDIDESATTYKELNTEIELSQVKLTPIGTIIQSMQKDIDAARSHWEVLDVAAQAHVLTLEDIVAKYKAWDEEDILSAAHKKIDLDLVTSGLDAIKAGIEAAQAPAKELNKLFQEFGITVHQVTETGTLENFNKLLLSGAANTDQLNGAWTKLAGMFKTSIGFQQQVLDLMIAQGRPIQDVLAQETKVLDIRMKSAQAVDMTGHSELAIAEALTKVQLQTWAVHHETMGLADAWNGVASAFGTAWDSFEKGVATAITNSKTFGDAMKSMLSALESQLVLVAVKFVLNQTLAAALTALFPTLNLAATTSAATVATSMATASSSMAASAASIAASLNGAAAAFSGFAASTSTSMATAATATATAAATMVSEMTLVAAAIGAIGSVIIAVELAHTNTLLTRIEESTRRMDITMEGILAKAAQSTLDHLGNVDLLLMQMLPYLANSQNVLIDISLHTLQIAQQIGQLIALGLAGGFGGGGTGSSGDGLAALIKTINDDFAAQAGMIGAVMNSIGSAAAGSGAFTPIIVGAGGAGSGSSSSPGLGSVSQGAAGTQAPITIAVTVQAGVVAGANGMNQLADMVGAKIVNNLKGVVGLKL